MATFAPLSPHLHTYFDEDTPEAQAHATVSDAGHMWDYAATTTASLNENILALAAAYLALNRYINGQDIYIMPHNSQDLEAILRRYSADAIHNYIAKSRTPLGVGGYSRTSQLASRSIHSVLARPENVTRLLDLHRQTAATPEAKQSATT